MVRLQDIFLLSVFAIVTEMITFGHSRSSRVQFFKETSYRSFVWEKELNPETDTNCITLPDFARNQIYQSIKTSQCIMVYNYPSCKTKRHTIGYSQKVTGNEPNFRFDSGDKISSFHICNEDQGAGQKVDVDFYDGSWNPIPYAQYRDICSCRTLPLSAVDDNIPLNMDNHGNCIRIFTEQNCKGASKDIRPGFSYSSTALHIVQPYDMKNPDSIIPRRPCSFQPCDISDCFKLNVTLYKVQFRNGTLQEDDALENIHVQLAIKTEFHNPLEMKTTQEYEINEKTEEAIEFNVADTFTSVHSVTVAGNVQIEAITGTPIVTTTIFRALFETNFNFQRIQGRTEARNKRVTHERIIRMKHTTEIPPCTEGIVTIFVRKQNNFPIDYTAWVKVTGEMGGEVMSAEEIRESIEGSMIEYQENYDSETILATFEGTMKATYGVSTSITTEGHKIQSCLDQHQLLHELPPSPPKKEEQEFYDDLFDNDDDD